VPDIFLADSAASSAIDPGTRCAFPSSASGGGQARGPLRQPFGLPPLPKGEGVAACKSNSSINRNFVKVIPGCWDRVFFMGIIFCRLQFLDCFFGKHPV